MADKPEAVKRSSPASEEKEATPKQAKTAVADKKNFVEGSVILIKADTYNPVWAKVKTDAKPKGEISSGELRRLVGGYIEGVPFEHIFKDELPTTQSRSGRHLTLFCNEEGRLEGLAYNQFAQEFGLAGGEGLVGDVVVAVGTRSGGTTVFTEADLELLPKALIP